MAARSRRPSFRETPRKSRCNSKTRLISRSRFGCRKHLRPCRFRPSLQGVAADSLAAVAVAVSAREAEIKLAIKEAERKGLALAEAGRTALVMRAGVDEIAEELPGSSMSPRAKS